MRYILALILAIALGGKTWASSADITMNNFTANGNFYVKTGFNSLLFNGAASSGNYVTIADSANNRSNATNYSVSVWVYPTGLGGLSQGRIFDKSDGATLSKGFKFFITTGNLVFVDFVASGAGHVTSSLGTVPFNQLSHIVVSKTLGSAPKIFINGVEYGYGVTDATDGGDDTGVAMVIGNRSAADRTFQGYISDVRVWQKALTVDDALQLYNSGNHIQGAVSPISGVKAEYKFNEGGGNVLYDTSIYANNGTLNGSPVWTNLSN